MPANSRKPPRVFLSYAWEDDAYRLKVKQLATRLRADGIDVRLDAWHALDVTIPEFMSRETRQADYVVILCSPKYLEKVHAMEDGERMSGVGYENLLFTSALWNTEKERRTFIAALFEGEWKQGAPLFLSAFPWLDLRPDRAGFEEAYRELLRRLTGQEEKAPPLGAIDLSLKPQPLAPLRGPVADAPGGRGDGGHGRPVGSGTIAAAALLLLGLVGTGVWWRISVGTGDVVKTPDDVGAEGEKEERSPPAEAASRSCAEQSLLQPLHREADQRWFANTLDHIRLENVVAKIESDCSIRLHYKVLLNFDAATKMAAGVSSRGRVLDHRKEGGHDGTGGITVTLLDSVGTPVGSGRARLNAAVVQCSPTDVRNAWVHDEVILDPTTKAEDVASARQFTIGIAGVDVEPCAPQ